jgi:hypothetical protein
MMRAEDAIAYLCDWVKVASRTVVLLPRDAEALEYLRGCARQLEDLAGTQARIRRLEKDLQGEREKSARERKTNAEFALLVHEARCHAAGLEEEIGKLRAELADILGEPQYEDVTLSKPLRIVRSGPMPFPVGPLLIPDSDTPGSAIAAAMAASGDPEEGEPTAGDYVASPPRTTKALEEHLASGGRLKHSSGCTCRLRDGVHEWSINGRDWVAYPAPCEETPDWPEQYTILPIEPAQQPEDAIARDIGAP